MYSHRAADLFVSTSGGVPSGLDFVVQSIVKKKKENPFLSPHLSFTYAKEIKEPSLPASLCQEGLRAPTLNNCSLPFQIERKLAYAFMLTALYLMQLKIRFLCNFHGNKIPSLALFGQKLRVGS